MLSDIDYPVEHTYPAIPEAVTAVRADLENSKPGPPLADRWADVKLAATELASNCVRHAPAAWFSLRVFQDDTGLRVELINPGPGFELSQTPPPATQPGGRGLMIVAALADHWGIDSNDLTTVWFEMAS